MPQTIAEALAIIDTREYEAAHCACGEQLDMDCWGQPRCPICDPPCPGCSDQ